MNLYQLGELHITENQINLLTTYLTLTENDPEKAHIPEDQRFFMGILEAFDNNPEKAAAVYNKVCTKADKAMLEHSENMMEKIPFPEEKNFFRRFSSLEEGKAYWEKIKTESGEVSYKIIEREFYGIVNSYHSEQINKPHSIQ